jgi:hypothetical protein
MIEGNAIKRAPTYLHLHLGDHLIRTVEDGELSTVQSTVALLRTIFEDHYVDPEHQSSLLFHGCTLSGSEKHPHDFTVVHRADRVILSEFTFKHRGPACVSLPLLAYTEELVKYGDTVLSSGPAIRPRPKWQQEFLDGQWEDLRKLHQLARQLLLQGLGDYGALRTEFIEVHGRLKRPLEMQVVSVEIDSGPRKPVVVQARIVFGPIGSGQRLPIRLNGGDVVLAHVVGFAVDGAILTLEGVGSGGVRIGDRLYGLQHFYP